MSAHCFHCGRPNPEPRRWRADRNGVAHAFCCAGCLGVAQTIHAAGLDAFYERRTARRSPPVATEARDEWSHWDEPGGAGGDSCARASRMRGRSRCCSKASTAARASGSSNRGCARAGHLSASVNYATRRARVVWDPRPTRLSAVLRAVAAIGYRAYPYDPARREALARRESRALLLRTGGRAARDDAGDDVRVAGLRHASTASSRRIGGCSNGRASR